VANYALVSDIQAEYKELPLTDSTAVKTAQVQSFLDQASAYINSKVGMRYVLPIPDAATGALNILKTICIFIVVERLKPILKIDTGASGGKGNQSPAATDLKKQADKMLDDIANGLTDLAVHGAILKSTGEGADSYNRRAGVTGTFKKGTDQW
jgi:phage gp36-like protein